METTPQIRRCVIALAASCISLLLFASHCTRAQTVSAAPTPPDRFRTFLFGADYYPEQWPERMWEQDAQRMQDAGVNAVRIGEFGWSVMEPHQGVYDFALFDKAIAILGRHGIRTILGTPTATPPKWLTHDYPEVLHVFPDGRKSNDQTRRHYCYNSALYRKFSRQIVEQMATHYQDNLNVIGWQIDNEFNNENSECFSDSCRAAFRVWLQKKYVDLDSLNARWGNRFWSQWYTSWDQIDLPFPATSLQNSALMLDFRRFISDSVSSYAGEQIEIIRRYRPHDFITTNGVFRNINYYSFSKPLDVYASDNYPTFSEAPQYPSGSSLTLIRGLNGHMMVMEELTGPAGQTYLLRTPRPGEMSLWAFQSIAHGADGVLHFRWRTALRGVEEYWSGVLDQDNIPAARYDEFKREGQQIRIIGPEILDSKLISQIAVLNDYESAWTYDFQYVTKELNTGTAYTNLFQAASELKFNIDFIGPDSSFEAYKIIFAPRLILIDPVMAQKIHNFVDHGGTFILAGHSALMDRDNAQFSEPRPALLSDLFGVKVESTQAYLSSTVKNDIRTTDGTALPANVTAEGLKIEGATVLGSWDRDFLSGAPAYTERRLGQGKAVYYGSFFNLDSARFLMRRATADADLQPLLSGIPKEVEVTRRSKGDTDYFFILNHQDQRVQIDPGEGYFDLLRQKPSPASVTLGPFQYTILRKTNGATQATNAASPAGKVSQ